MNPADGGATMPRLAFSPPHLLRGPHLQSLIASSAPRRVLVHHRARGLLASSEPRVLECGGGARLAAAANILPGAAPLAVLIHGWEGSAQSTYLVSLAGRLAREGYSVVRLNLRDHGDSHHLNREMFHSCRLDEVVAAVRAVQDLYRPARLYLAGFSLGGNFTMRVAVRAPGAGIDLAHALAICPVLEPAETMHALDHGPAIYRWYFIRKWRRSLRKKQLAFPHVYRFGKLARFRRLEPMTDYFATRYAGFPDLATYLSGYAITGERLADLAVPSTMLLAEDDPIIPVNALERVARPAALTTVRSRLGGHCGFLADYRLRSAVNDFVLDRFAG